MKTFFPVYYNYKGYETQIIKPSELKRGDVVMIFQPIQGSPDMAFHNAASEFTVTEIRDGNAHLIRPYAVLGINGVSLGWENMAVSQVHPVSLQFVLLERRPIFHTS